MYRFALQYPGMHTLPPTVTQAIEALSALPGIGSRSAERLVFSLLQNRSGLDRRIAQSIGQLREKVTECERCANLSEGPLCMVCQNPGRDGRTLCIVESPLDILALERTHEYKGLYHVLHGVISPLRKIRPEDIRLALLWERIQKEPDIQEIVLATSAGSEGEATALYIMEHLKSTFSGRVTRIARGIPTGGDLDYLDAGTLTRAMADRQPFA